jgi:hypothetical protein
MMTDINSIWETLKAEAEKGQPRPDERTVSQFAEETGLSRYKAKTFLNQQVAEGKLNRREIKKVFYYSPA